MTTIVEHDGFNEGKRRLEHFARKGGLFLLSGEIGAGKTTLVRSFLKRLSPANFIPIYTEALVGMRISLAFVILEAFEALGEKASYSLGKNILKFRSVISSLNEKHGKMVMLVVDEAQNLDIPSFKNLKILIDREIPFGLILVGPTDLRRTLGMRYNEELWQRITLSWHMEPLSLDAAKEYIREKAARYEEKGFSFTSEVSSEIHRLSRGIPRMIDKVIELSIWGADAAGQRAIDILLLEKVAKEIVPGWESACNQSR